MYRPRHFDEQDTDALRELIEAAPLATFIVHSDDGLLANHIPFVLDGVDLSSGTLRAHIPRANPLSSVLEVETPCLAIFHGPQGYISPSYYATKPRHGKVVPTWNYSVAHIHGRARAVHDGEWIRAQMEQLTTLHEGPRAAPWAVSDAPDDYIDTLMKALVGIEVTIERLEGKTKASQNQPEENQRSVLEAMDREHSNEHLASLMRSVLRR